MTTETTPATEDRREHVIRLLAAEGWLTTSETHNGDGSIRNTEMVSDAQPPSYAFIDTEGTVTIRSYSTGVAPVAKEYTLSAADVIAALETPFTPTFSEDWDPAPTLAEQDAIDDARPLR